MSDIKRTDYAIQQDVHPHYDLSPVEVTPVPEMAPVPTQVTHIVKTEAQLPDYSTHFTTILQPKSVTMLLPLDPDRYRASFWLVTSSVYAVACDALEAAQAAGNIATTGGGVPPTPAGTVLSTGMKLDEYDSEPLWVVNCDPTTAAYVSVIIERR